MGRHDGLLKSCNEYRHLVHSQTSPEQQSAPLAAPPPLLLKARIAPPSGGAQPAPSLPAPPVPVGRRLPAGIVVRDAAATPCRLEAVADFDANVVLLEHVGPFCHHGMKSVVLPAVDLPGALRHRPHDGLPRLPHLVPPAGARPRATGGGTVHELASRGKTLASRHDRDMSTRGPREGGQAVAASSAGSSAATPTGPSAGSSTCSSTAGSLSRRRIVVHRIEGEEGVDESVDVTAVEERCGGFLGLGVLRDAHLQSGTPRASRWKRLNQPRGRPRGDAASARSTRRQDTRPRKRGRAAECRHLALAAGEGGA